MILSEAKAMQGELVCFRRYLHENAEVGFALTKTVAFVKSELEKIGCEPKSCGRSGVVATIGKGSPVFLLRADMDGLPIQERSGLRYACANGNMHACGHDLHTAALLGAAKILKKREGRIKGSIRLVFQPAEEILEGAKDVINSGVLEGVNAGMMLHVTTGAELPTGVVVVAPKGVSAPAADYFKIETVGKGCHGSAPWNGVDALTVAARILLALQELSAREIPIATPAVLTVGTLKAEGTGNAISDRAALEGTLRAFDEGIRERVKRRMEDISKNVAKAFRAKASVSYGGGCPTLVNDGELCAFAERTAKGLLGASSVLTAEDLGKSVRVSSGGSEDFAYFSHEIPTVMLALGAGEKGKGYEYPLHHPKVKFDENALCIGAALYARIALEWLKKDN